MLKGRKIVAFPDIDGYDEWQCKLSEYPELAVTISPVLQQNSTKEDRDAHIDIADWLLRYMFGPAGSCHSERSPKGGVEESRWHQEFLKAAEFISPENHEEVEAFIRDLELEFWGAVKIETKEDEESP